MIFLNALKIHASDDTKEMLHAGHLFLPSTCGTCTTKPTMSFQELTTVWKDGIMVFKETLPDFTQHFAAF